MFSFVKKEKTITAVGNGQAYSIKEVKDDMFSKEMMGPGIAFHIDNGKVYAPISGTLVSVFPTNHCFGITAEDGLEVLVHIGIDTVHENGEGFVALKKINEKVKQGEAIVEVDWNLLKNKGYDMSVIMVFPSSPNNKIHIDKYGEVLTGAPIARYR